MGPQVLIAGAGRSQRLLSGHLCKPVLAMGTTPPIPGPDCPAHHLLLWEGLSH